MIDEEKRRLINERYLRLIDMCKPYFKEGDLKKINKAYELAFKAEFEEEKITGKLDIQHSIEIAAIAVEKIGLGTTSVICALLHNTYEKSKLIENEIKDRFGPVVFNIINGFKRISEITTQKASFNSENLRKLYLSLVDDIRVVLIKLAHRLHDMRIYDQLDKDKQKKYLQEVNYIYIPIAHRLGLYSIKEELEELVMKQTHPKTYKEISDKLQETKTKRNVFIQDFTDPIRRELIKQGFDVEIKGRPKSIHSIWNKMKKQNLPFEEVYDLFAIRIISNSKPKNEKSDCWRIYSIVTDIYPPNPKRLRDWISTPKASGYESLHTTVKAQNDKWVEVQIRTTRMDETAEKGQAAHWIYKGFANKQETETWLNQVRDILENPKQIDFDDVDPKKIAVRQDKIFVFTPGGDLKKLPENSTVLDFAYEIHTDLGHSCNGAKVNGKNVPIRHVLNNGDKVEIFKSKNQKPKLDWLAFVNTPKAKAKIKRAVLEERFNGAEAGNEILRRRLKNWKIQFNDENIDKLVKHYKYPTSIDLYYAIATEKIDMPEVKKILQNGDKEKANDANAVRTSIREKHQKEFVDSRQDTLIIDDKLKDINYHLAKCCNPVWGDPVFGFVTIGKGITIHRLNCPNAGRLLSDYDYRIIDVSWCAKEDEAFYQATIRVEGDDRIGIMGEITNIISNDLKVNMLSLNIDSDKGMFIGKIKVQIPNRDYINELIHKISKLNGVKTVKRVPND